MSLSFWNKHKQSITYGIAMALLLFVLKWIELQFLIVNHTTEIYTGTLALLFTSLGIWLALKLKKPQINTVVVEREIVIEPPGTFTLNKTLLSELNISNRELEVLKLMAAGLSNQEIAGQLFVSLNTIKTHAARLFEKLEVNRRTQAVEKAKRLGLIP